MSTNNNMPGDKCKNKIDFHNGSEVIHNVFKNLLTVIQKSPRLIVVKKRGKYPYSWVNKLINQGIIDFLSGEKGVLQKSTADNITTTYLLNINNKYI